MKKIKIQAVAGFVVGVLLPVLAFAEGHEEAHHGNPAPDVKFLYTVINFAILVGVLVYFLRKPMVDFFRNRSEQTKNQAESSQRLFAEAKRQFDEIDRKLTNSQKEGVQLIADLKAEGEAEKQRMIANAKMASEQLIADTKRTVEQESRKAQEIIKAEAVRLAVELAETQVRAQIKPDDQARLGGEFLTLLKKAGQS